ncbi:hypothetical protein [Phyllobacterium sp. YR531]|uniref:hypothetical protein n=1 Tax=Phyllobacterium sp. YR531 TaxID=1144343 RepID=UPI0012F6FE5D|nr:hypothetical protein [Phyllobacterium sp. YR531]
MYSLPFQTFLCHFYRLQNVKGNVWFRIEPKSYFQQPLFWPFRLCESISMPAEKSFFARNTAVSGLILILFQPAQFEFLGGFLSAHRIAPHPVSASMQGRITTVANILIISDFQIGPFANITGFSKHAI